MFNVLIDRFPKEYEGYLIRWQFYNGIIISDTLAQTSGIYGTEYGQIEKLYAAFEILYGKGIPPFETALAGLNWFFDCGEEQKPENEDENKDKDKEKRKNPKLFSFESDKNRLYSAFLVKYGIDLNTADDMHWFKFIALMNDLSDTAFRNVIDIRSKTDKEIKKYSKDVQAEIRKQKKIFAIEQALDVKYTPEQNKMIDHFDQLVGKK
ncbi:MAG: bacteriophage Gp15 family protein [Novosphingobium sp.]|nr:bacteriophage Gp15 family protein [Novosphingobium sp.]